MIEPSLRSLIKTAGHYGDVVDGPESWRSIACQLHLEARLKNLFILSLLSRLVGTLGVGFCQGWPRVGRLRMGLSRRSDPQKRLYKCAPASHRSAFCRYLLLISASVVESYLLVPHWLPARQQHQMHSSHLETRGAPPSTVTAQWSIGPAGVVLGCARNPHEAITC